ncbi:MAG: MBL fold metallo-hydrolase [Gammaproteobacteria bacterium]|nr:MBL fold metallo-hydrolase [Gammaproteobacteria bacterium]
MEVESLFDERTFTLTHIAYDPVSLDAVIFDPVLDLDTVAWKTYTDSLHAVDQFIQGNNLKLHYVIDTHVHADHLSGMQYLKKHYQVPLVINASITQVQEIFKDTFNLPDDFHVDARQFDILVNDADCLTAGTLHIDVIHTPGHTPACTSYKIDDAVFTGDALFMPDIGTGRCDFPKGSARDLYYSIKEKLYKLPDDTRVYPGHDYPQNRALRTWTTILESKQSNVDLNNSRSEQDYVSFMQQRDARLPLPRLIYQSVQVNINAGQLPDAEANGRRYLKIPIESQ